jgi:hypothetical protein
MGGGNAQKSAKARAEAQKKAAENKVPLHFIDILLN